MEPLYQVNLELGNPEPKRAVKYLEFIIASVRANNGKVIKAWHGNAETESHGALKAPIRAALRRLKRQGRVNFFICSENYNENDEASRYLIDKYPLAKEKDADWGSGYDTYVMICL
ncbi:MAG: hypothetical protein ACI4SP_03280 [Eubacteriales bacterium]|nr:hypothetical protein [Clostridia bacterium]MDY6184573.1 hypothetical protein [Eubacteriales bacterium]